MEYDRRKRILLNALLKGLDRAIRRDDLSAAERYCKRLLLSTEPIAADSLVKGASKKLLLISGLWMNAPNVERDETRQQLLDLIDHLISLLDGDGQRGRGDSSGQLRRQVRPCQCQRFSDPDFDIELSMRAG